MLAGRGAGQQAALGVVKVLFHHPALRSVENSHLGDRSIGRFADRTYFQTIARQRKRALMWQGRIEFGKAQGLDQPVGLDGNGISRRAGGELIVPAIVHCRRLAAANPIPKNIGIAPQVDFRSGQARDGLQAKISWPLTGDTGPQGGKTRPGYRGVIRPKRLNLRVIAVDHLHYLVQRGRNGQNPRQNGRRRSQHVRATGAANGK